MIKIHRTNSDNKDFQELVEILNELENWAIEEGYKFAVLETGKKQPEAIRLYQKSGYELTENYGQYKDVENSVCMKKILA